MILLILNTVVEFFFTYPVTKRCQRCRAIDISFGRKRQKKKLAGKRKAEISQKQQIIITNFLFSI